MKVSWESFDGLGSVFCTRIDPLSFCKRAKHDCISSDDRTVLSLFRSPPQKVDPESDTIFIENCHLRNSILARP
jgi:hypothetical protein